MDRWLDQVCHVLQNMVYTCALCKAAGIGPWEWTKKALKTKHRAECKFREVIDQTLHWDNNYLPFVPCSLLLAPSPTP